MSIVDMLVAVGIEHVQYQMLHGCLVGARQVKHGTHITFGTQAVTPADYVNSKPGRVGIVIWVPVDQWERVQEHFRAQLGGQPSWLT